MSRIKIHRMVLADEVVSSISYEGAYFSGCYGLKGWRKLDKDPIHPFHTITVTTPTKGGWPWSAPFCKRLAKNEQKLKRELLAYLQRIRKATRAIQEANARQQKLQEIVDEHCT